MNRELKQKIEEAAEGYYPKLEDRWINMAFRAGAQFLLDEGYRFAEEDMIDFVEYCHINAYKPEEVIGMYTKEKENEQ